MFSLTSVPPPVSLTWRKPVIFSCRVQILLKVYKHPADFFRSTQIGERISNRVVVFQLQQRRELFLRQFVCPTLRYRARTKSRNACCL